MAIAGRAFFGYPEAGPLAHPVFRSSRRPNALLTVSAAYVGITLAMTWPLARGLARDLPADLGDSLLNCYLLDWTAHRLQRLAQGDWRAFDGYWSAGIFHPEPLTLTYSDHLFAQAAQILPVYALTDNLILCYNVLFLSTFVLSALGTFVLVRDLTGSRCAAFVAGLFYAFAPYRVAQLPHLQVLSSQWMPFALAGLRRFFDTGRFTALGAAGAALLAENLSSGYLMVFFGPFVLAYCLYEIVRRGFIRDRRVWTALTLTGSAVAILTAPFVWPYREARALGIPPRSLEEVRFYSADLLSYLTTTPLLRLWGSVMTARPKPEGELFPGLTPLAFAAVAISVSMLRGSRRGRERPRTGRLRRMLAVVALGATVVYGLAFATAFWTDTLDLGLVIVRLRGKWRVALIFLGALGALLALSPRARAILAGDPRNPTSFYAGALVAAAVLSCGPVLTVGGDVRLDPAPYWLFYRYVPGFDALRVPARFGMLVAVFLAVLGGLGAATIARRAGRAGRLAVLVGGLAFLVEAAAVPIPVNLTEGLDGYATPAPRVVPARDAPPVYRFLRTLPADAVIAEFPFGIDAYEVRYLYYATVHRHRLVNGYSGYFPSSYQRRKRLFSAIFSDPDRAWRELRASGATYVVLHEGAYRGDEGARVGAWLRGYGASEIARFDGDLIYRLPAHSP